ncbi:7038_t:CDS:2, partial [Gigaspora rosea]
MRKGSSEKKYDLKMQKVLFEVTRQEKTLVRLEIIRGVILIERVQKEKEGITKDNKCKPKEAEEKAKTDLVKKRRKGKEKQTLYPKAGGSNPQPEQSTRRAEREVNKENQDPQQKGNETERKKREKKEEAKLEI